MSEKAEQIVATIDRRAVRRFVVRCLALSALQLAGLVVCWWLCLVTGALSSPLAVVLIVALIAGGAEILHIFFCLLLQWRETSIALDGQSVYCRTKRRRLSAVALDNIAEIHIRKEGSAPGLGFVLLRPECVGLLGFKHRILPRCNYLFVKCHLLTPPVYREPLEDVAAAIASAAEAARGTSIPVKVVTPLGTKPLMPRPGQEEVAIVAETDVPVARPAQRATVGIVCVQCGYDLRGIPLAARCPECGAPVRRSEHGRVLGVADRKWVRRLMRGSSVLAVSSVLQLFFILLLWQGLWAVIGGGTPSLAWALLLVVLFVFTFACVWFGAWLLTRREPTHTAQPPSRRLVRICMLLPLVFVSGGLARLIPPAAAAGGCLVTIGAVTACSLWYGRHLFTRLARPNWRIAAALAAACHLPLLGGCLLVMIGAILGSWLPRGGPPGMAGVPSTPSTPTSMPAAGSATAGATPQGITPATLPGSIQFCLIILGVLFVPAPVSAMIVLTGMSFALRKALRDHVPPVPNGVI